jgi:hypothetical protein
VKAPVEEIGLVKKYSAMADEQRSEWIAEQNEKRKLEKIAKWDSLDYKEKQKLDPGRLEEEEMKKQEEKRMKWEEAQRNCERRWKTNNWDRLSMQEKEEHDPERYKADIERYKAERESRSRPLEMPAANAVAPAPVPTIAPPKAPSGKLTKIKSLIKLSSLSEDDKNKIENKLIRNIENPYYKLNDKVKNAYKNPKIKFRAKAGNVFENIEAIPKKSKKAAAFATEPPPPTSDNDPVSSVSEVNAVNQQVKPPPVRKRKLDLVK